MSGWLRMRDWIHSRVKKRSRTDYLILLLAGVLVMVIAIPTGSVRQAPATSDTQQEESGEDDAAAGTEEDYRQTLQSQLEELLAQMDGVGRCRVMITLEDDGQTYVDKDVRAQESGREEETVVFRQEEGEEPYVVRQRLPRVAGVVVVAQGGGSAKVITDISNAVMSLFQIEAHKITVVKMSVQEE